MKILFIVNLIAFIINIGLYIIEPVLGLFAQIGLGLLQILSALRMSLETNKINKKAQKNLVRYWLSIFIWVLLGLIVCILFDSVLAFKIMIIICPMSIAFYFVTITYLTQLK